MWNVNYTYVNQKQFKFPVQQCRQQQELRKYAINKYTPIDHNDIGSASAMMIVAMLV